MGLFRRRHSEPTVKYVEDAGRVDVRERGSFAFGVCSECDWVGPGRRARSGAEIDAREHRTHCGAQAASTTPA